MRPLFSDSTSKITRGDEITSRRRSHDHHFVSHPNPPVDRRAASLAPIVPVGDIGPAEDSG
jgi:hypothetical protein